MVFSGVKTEISPISVARFSCGLFGLELDLDEGVLSTSSIAGIYSRIILLISWSFSPEE